MRVSPRTQVNTAINQSVSNAMPSTDIAFGGQMHVQALTKCCPSVPDVGKLCLDAPIPGLVYMSVRPSLVDLTRLFAATPCVRPSSPPPPPHNHHTTRTPSNISNNTSTRTLTHAGVLCSSDSQTNFVNVHQHDGTILPWIEINEEQTAAAQVTEPPKPKTKNRMSSTTWTNVWVFFAVLCCPRF